MSVSCSRIIGVRVPVTSSFESPGSANILLKSSRTDDVTDRLHQLEESEARRQLLVQKMKEAQHTIMLHSQRVAECEHNVNEKTAELEQLKLKEQDNRRKLNNLGFDYRKISERLSEYSTLKDEMQKKFESQCYEMETLQSTKALLISECEQKTLQLQQLTSTISHLESQVIQHQADSDRDRRELSCLRGSIEVAQSRAEHYERQNIEVERDNQQLKQENHSLIVDIKSIQRQLMDANNIISSNKENTAHLLEARTELTAAIQRCEGMEGTVKEVRMSLSTLKTENERLVGEKLQLHQQLQTQILDTEKMKSAFDQVISDLETQLNDSQETMKLIVDKEQSVTRSVDAERKMTLSQLKSKEDMISSVTSRLQIITNEHDDLLKRHAKCDDQLVQLRDEVHHKTKLLEESEIRLAEQVDKLQVVEHQNEILTSENRQLNKEKLELEIQLREMLEKLDQSDCRVKSQFDELRIEMEKWKTACNRQADTLRKKDLEVTELSKTVQDLKDEVGFLKVNHNVYESQHNELVELRQKIVRCDDEVRRLMLERNENQQVIELLEMQKGVLLQLCQPAAVENQPVEDTTDSQLQHPEAA